MFQIIKDNILSLLIVIVVLVLGFKYVPPEVTKAIDLAKQTSSAKQELSQRENNVSSLRAQAEAAARAKVPPKDGKKIYELEGAQFSAEASFAPLFEVVLSIAQNSGIKIRSINYNYAPEGDPVYAAHLPEYNVCELQIQAIGSYVQLQTFFKGLMKDNNLNYLAEVEMQPWEKDKTILITNVKIRLYTKTPGSSPKSAASAGPQAPMLP